MFHTQHSSSTLTSSRHRSPLCQYIQCWNKMCWSESHKSNYNKVSGSGLPGHISSLPVQLLWLSFGVILPRGCLQSATQDAEGPFPSCSASSLLHVWSLLSIFPLSDLKAGCTWAFRFSPDIFKDFKGLFSPSFEALANTNTQEKLWIGKPEILAGTESWWSVTLFLVLK